MFLPRAEHLQRTFMVRCGNSRGTGFLIERNGRVFLVTAEHLLAQKDTQPVQLLKNHNTFIDLNWSRLGKASDFFSGADVAVILDENFQGEKMTIPASGIGYSLGQEVFFLGFPFEIDTENLPGSDDWMMPFVKRASIAAFSKCRNKIYLDGINNVGFSGGPVICLDDQTGKLHVIGVISSYIFDHHPVHTTENWFEQTAYMARGNSGIIEATSMFVVNKVIDEMLT